MNREINLIRNVFVIARKEWQWLGHNPFEGLNLPPEGSARTRRVDPWKEVRPIVRWLGYRTGMEPVPKNQEVALIWLIALRTGMRAGEILRLGKQTLNLKSKVAEVKHKMQYLTRAPRKIPLTRQGVRLLQVVSQREECFTVSPDSMSTFFAKARKSLGIKGMTFHDSCGEALTRLARKVDVLTLSKISGIKDIRILQEHYYRETSEQIAARL